MNDIQNPADYDMDKINAMPVFDVADHLDCEEMILAYLAEFADEHDATVLAAVHRDIEKARARLAAKAK